jgi:nucleotide-binding universal stress UspA family protein
MDNKLVTLAIRTYQRAQMIKSILEENGIETVIHNLNQAHPEMAVGVRIRIKESDLPRALKLVEEKESAWETDLGNPQKNKLQQVLIPIDFSDHTTKVLDFGFHFAQSMKAEVVLYYVFFNPNFSISTSDDVSKYSINDNELVRRAIGTANADVENMTNLINKRIDRGELPDVPFRFKLKEGVPEDEILDYCKRNKPALVVMATHGRQILASDLIGSVTAEVMESCESPVFAVPMQSMIEPDDLHKVAFLTNFDQKDLIAIDRTISLLGAENIEISFIHASTQNEAWSEVMLAGIKVYFEKHYPELRTNYALIAAMDDMDILGNFLVHENISVLAFNTKRRNIFARIFHLGLAFKLVLHSNTPLLVTHV